MTIDGSPTEVRPNPCTPGRSSPPVRVLIVDDNEHKRAAARAALAPLRLEVVEAASGLAALRCIMATQFAAILLDVRMPVMDGFETAALIRQREQSEMTPIIFITAHGPDEIELADRYADGAVDFLFAPVPPDVLRAKVSVFANLFVGAERLARRAREVQNAADELLLLTEAAPVGIFHTDSTNHYLYTNPRWSEITGIPSAEAIGQSWDVFVDPDHPDAETVASSSADAGAGEVSLRYEIRVPGTGRKIVLVSSKAIPGRDGAAAGWVGTLADVTAEAGAEAAMAEARDSALAASAMQETFAESASHELRTPTTVILGYAEEMAESPTMPEEHRHFATIVHRNAQRLSHLIDDLLIVGQSAIGPSMMHLEATEIPVLVERVASTFAEAAQRKELNVIVRCGTRLPPAYADVARLEQVLTNLVGNAVKFTPDGGTITMTVERADDSLRIAVADTGPGIAPDDLERIFGRFYRTTSAVDGAVKGSGLGLAIAKGMVEAQHGRIEVLSDLGLGSTFTVTLPISEESAPSLVGSDDAA